MRSPKMCGFANPSLRTMTTQTLDGVSVTARASVYFDGRCVSHALKMPDGSRKSVGVVLPATLTFKTDAAETMECVGGSCDYRLGGQDTWHKCTAGDSFSVPAQSQFDISVAEAFHYICHYA